MAVTLPEAWRIVAELDASLNAAGDRSMAHLALGEQGCCGARVELVDGVWSCGRPPQHAGYHGRWTLEEAARART